MIAESLNGLPGEVPQDTSRIDKAHVLDSYYVASRYPKGHVEGAPYEQFGGLQSEEPIRYAGEILGLARAYVTEGE